MAKTTIALCAAALCGALCGPAGAQESLLDVYRRALQNDPVIREAEAIYLANAEIKPQARALLLPSLSLSSGRQNFFQRSEQGVFDPDTGTVLDVPTTNERDTRSWSVNVNQTIFDWGLYAQLRRADKQVEQAATALEAERQNLMLRVASVYFDVLAAEDVVAASAVTRDARARQLEQAQRRHEVGLIAVTDVEEFQAAYDQSVAAEIAAQRSLATAQEFLREVINDIPSDLAGVGDDLPLLSPDPANIDQWVQTALEQNLTLVSSRIAADIAQDTIDIQRAERFPSLNLQAGYNEQNQESLSSLRPDEPFTTKPSGRNWSLQLQFPIFTGGLNRSRIRQSVYQHRASLEQLEQVARATERQARDAYLGVLSEIQRVRALAQAVQSSQTALRATEAGFEVGTRTVVDVVTSQDNLSAAQVTYASSRYQYILNLLLLKQAAGTLSEADLEQVDEWLRE